MRFADFFRVSIFLECQHFVNLAVQGEEQPDTELFLRVAPFYILRYLWSDGGEEENCGWGEGWGKSVSPH